MTSIIPFCGLEHPGLEFLSVHNVLNNYILYIELNELIWVNMHALFVTKLLIILAKNHHDYNYFQQLITG